MADAFSKSERDFTLSRKREKIKNTFYRDRARVSERRFMWVCLYMLHWILRQSRLSKPISPFPSLAFSFYLFLIRNILRAKFQRKVISVRYQSINRNEEMQKRVSEKE